ncbi:NAD(P)H-dependent oxidoreductase [Psychrosphaera ytuae]|uniref:NAD(P)H-dependent oxidoreductase n=1 Tax=Psychrosphaera ytuae TaxID=2820710 RepID=A0A975DD91_9GAMM|nr:NAD(P)H-dependent oxidoreductase [Psychrosphaera ytuae]QTH65030.1 NAD(P)H-dependent oxidoreductase [Psychrosphaera ytuae]
MQSVLLILAHPNLEQSKINRHLIQRASRLDFVTVHDLYDEYPDGVIDIEAEQRRLAQFDNVVFQHPFYWYSCPSLLKEWFDLVLQYNYAYGPNGDALKGKNWLSVISTGGGQRAYCETGHNRFTMTQLLAPYDQTAHLCQMNYLSPFIIHGSRKLFADKPRLEQVTADYIQTLQDLSEGKLLSVKDKEWDTLAEGQE